MALDQMMTMLGGIASGSLAGKQQAQQENDQEQQRQQQQFLQVLPLISNLQGQQRNAAAAPYEALKPYVKDFDPASKASFLTSYGNVLGQPQQALPWAAGAKLFDEDSPLRGIFAGMAQPPVGQPGAYGTPPTSPQPSQQPPGVGMPQLPGGGIQAPGMAPGGAPVAPGGAASPPTIRTSFGNFNLEGVSDKQRTAALQRFDKIAQTYRDADLDPVERQRIEGILQNTNRNPQSLEELHALEASTGQLESSSVGLGPRLAAERDRRMKGDLTDYTLRGKTLREGKLSLNQFRTYLRDTVDMEGRLGRYHAETAQPLGEWQGYKEQLDAIDSGLASKDPEEQKKAKGDLADLRADIVNGQTPEQAGRETADAMRIIGQMDPRDAADPAKVAAAVSGRAPGFAKRIQEEGLRFGGGRPQRLFSQLMGQYKDISKPGTSEAVRQLWLDSITGAGRVLGQKVSLTTDDLMNTDPMLAAKLKKINLEVQLDQGKIKMQPLEQKTREARLDNIISTNPEIKARTAETIARTKAIGEKSKAGVAQKGLLTQNAQLRIDTEAEKTASKTYWDTVKTNGLNFDPGFDVTKPRPGHPGDVAAAKAYQTYREARVRTQNTLRGMKINVQDENWNPISGSADKRPLPTATPATAKVSSTPATAKPSLQQVREAYYQGLLKIGATQHEANALMLHRFPTAGASP